MLKKFPELEKDVGQQRLRELRRLPGGKLSQKDVVLALFYTFTLSENVNIPQELYSYVLVLVHISMVWRKGPASRLQGHEF